MKLKILFLIVVFGFQHNSFLWAEEQESVVDAKKIDSLIEALKDINPDSRNKAAFELGAMGARSVEPLIKALKESQTENTKQGKAVEDRKQILYALSQIGPQAAPAVNALIVSLLDSDQWVRTYAAAALAAIGPASAPATSALTVVLKNDRDIWAIHALAAIRRPVSGFAVSVLWDILKDKKENKDLRKNAAWALGQQGVEEDLCRSDLTAEIDPDFKLIAPILKLFETELKYGFPLEKDFFDLLKKNEIIDNQDPNHFAADKKYGLRYFQSALNDIANGNGYIRPETVDPQTELWMSWRVMHRLPNGKSETFQVFRNADLDSPGEWKPNIVLIKENIPFRRNYNVEEIIHLNSIHDATEFNKALSTSDKYGNIRAMYDAKNSDSK